MSVSNLESFVVIYWSKKKNDVFSVKNCEGEVEKNKFVSKCEADGYRYIVVKRAEKKNEEVFELMEDGFGRKLNYSIITFEIVWFLFLCLVCQYMILVFFYLHK